MICAASDRGGHFLGRSGAWIDEAFFSVKIGATLNTLDRTSDMRLPMRTPTGLGGSTNSERCLTCHDKGRHLEMVKSYGGKWACPKCGYIKGE